MRQRLLDSHGYQDVSKVDSVWHLRHRPSLDELVIVPKTLRADIRVHYTTPESERPTWATKRWVDLAWCCFNLGDGA